MYIITRNMWRLVFAVLFISLSESARAEEPNLSSLSDVKLFLHKDQEKAQAILDDRTRNYSPKEIRSFKERLRAEINYNSENPALRSGHDLLEQIKNPALRNPGSDPAFKFCEAFSRATTSEKASLRDRLLSDWESVSYPPLTDAGPNAEEERALFQTYLQIAPQLYATELDVLTMLERRCLKRKIEGEMVLFLQGLQAQTNTAGSLTAERVAQMFKELPKWGVPEIGYSERSDIVPYIYNTLSKCGADGLEVLVRLGLTATDNGVQTLGALDVPGTEELLWGIYRDSDEKFGSFKLKVLSAIQSKQKRHPTDDRRDLIRQELALFLRIPEEEFSLAVIDTAVQVAGQTGDIWFIKLLDAVESQLPDVLLDQSYEYANNPDNAKSWQENCLDSIRKARGKLSKSS
jgi:hypothetical protein